MEANSVEKFKINHLRQRIAQMSVQHEDALADAAVARQLLKQEADALRELVGQRDSEISELKAELEGLRPPKEEEPEETPDSDPENSPEG